MSGDIRPGRHALLKLDALLHQVAMLRDEGNAACSIKMPGTPVGAPHRRTVRDYERPPASHEAMILWAMVALMTRRLATTAQ